MNPGVPDRSREPQLPSGLEHVRARTPARIFAGRAGGSYRTETLLDLRADHAAARDAVEAELDLPVDLGADFLARWGLFEVRTRAGSKQVYLLRPDLGRVLEDEAREVLRQRCPSRPELQVAIGDGLSAAAVAAQVRGLVPRLADGAAVRGWRFGQPFFVRHCRVGVLNEIGELIDPAVAVLLIGERPGLATAQSLSAYLAFRPRAGHDDSRRNLISNIHARGVPPDQAAARVLRLADQMMARQTSGVAVKEDWDPSALSGDGQTRVQALGAGHDPPS